MIAAKKFSRCGTVGKLQRHQIINKNIENIEEETGCKSHNYERGNSCKEVSGSSRRLGLTQSPTIFATSTITS
jgi:hypothetical protein